MSSTFSKLYAMYGDWLRAKARSMGATDSEDVTQQTFLRVIASMPLDQIGRPRALLRTVASNLHRDTHRRIQAQGGAAIALDELPASQSPWVAPDQETSLLLKQVVLSLPPIYRDTFVLNRFMGFTYAQIAQRFGITTKAVEYRMARALALCLEALKD